MASKILQSGNVTLKINDKEIKDIDQAEIVINHEPQFVSIDKYKKVLHFVKWVAAGVNYKTRTGYQTADMCYKIANELLKELEDK
jgi:hypothetical protein